MTSVPVLVGHVEQHPVAGDAGVVDDDVEAALASAVATNSSAVDALADVARDRDGLRAGSLDLVEDVGGVKCGLQCR